jgi:hypothetical protein
MLTDTPKWSHARDNEVVPSRWQATESEPVTARQPTTLLGWWRLLLAALAAAVVTLLGAGTASAVTVPVLETRVGASTPATAYTVGPHECITAGQRWGNAPPAADPVVAIGVAANTGLHGFSSADEVASFAANLRGGLAKAGYDDVTPIMQGSAVTGRSHRGWAFDAGPKASDFDVALASPTLLARAQSLGIGLRSGGVRTGPLRQGDLGRLGLRNVASSMSASAGRSVNFMIFDSPQSAIARGPSVVL